MTLVARLKLAPGLLRRLALDRDGASAVELGVLLPVIAGLIIPMVDLGMGVYTQMQVQTAAQVGAQYAATAAPTGGTAWGTSATDQVFFNATNVTAAAQGATPLGSAITVPTVSESCGCLNGTTIQTNGSTPPCTLTCATGTVGVYVTVQAQTSYTPLFNYPMLPSPVTLSAQTTVRVN